MQERQEQIKLYNFFQKAVYILVLADFFILFCRDYPQAVLSQLALSFSKMGFLYPTLHIKLFQVVMVVLVSTGTKARKNSEINVVKSIILPILFGLLIIFASTLLIPYANNVKYPILFLKHFNLYHCFYLGASLTGVLVLMVGTDNVSKLIQFKLGKDKWNVEEESFDQNKEKVDNDLTINIPYLFYYKGKMHSGWLNVNPFRGTIVIGTPGSGKTFGIINPSIRQMISKNFTMCLYDFKFPDLGQIAYYSYLLKKKRDSNYKHRFAVVNINDVEKYVRVNPFKSEFIRQMSDAQEMAESMVNALQKGGSSAGGGADAFFTQSAINFLSATVYFFATYADGKYSDLPHILSFLNRSYEEIFDTLFTSVELHSLLSTFKSAYDNKAFDQLEGQIGTLKIYMSRLHTKESAWVLSGDDVKLNISNPENPTVLVLASDPRTQDQNSAIYSAILNKIIQQINTKKNYPSAVIADEFPTIYIHKVDNLIATARSNKVAVLLGLQEVPQLRQYYKKEVADTIIAIIGNIFSGSARDKSTLDWLEKLFGKVKQQSKSVSVSDNNTSYSISEKMENLIPAAKIASLKTGEMVGLLAKDVSNDSDNTQVLEYSTSVFNGKINLNMTAIRTEEANYPEMPTYYKFEKDGKDIKNDFLFANYLKINNEIDYLIKKEKDKKYA
jgi:hypothetical protein